MFKLLLVTVLAFASVPNALADRHSYGVVKIKVSAFNKGDRIGEPTLLTIIGSSNVGCYDLQTGFGWGSVRLGAGTIENAGCMVLMSGFGKGAYFARIGLSPQNARAVVAELLKDADTEDHQTSEELVDLLTGFTRDGFSTGELPYATRHIRLGSRSGIHVEIKIPKLAEINRSN